MMSVVSIIINKLHMSTVNSAVGTLPTTTDVDDMSDTVIVWMTGCHRLAIMVRYIDNKTFS